ncbi:dynein axonemal heavy chain 11 [Cyanocitta cristata]
MTPSLKEAILPFCHLELWCVLENFCPERCTKIEGKKCEFNRNFHLILHTKLANPHKPELQAQTTLINFTVTRDRLEEQLLAEAVHAEKQDSQKCKEYFGNCLG